jgi:hypothetical protein
MAKNSTVGQRPTQEEIAACAHLIYEKEGRPEGKALQHWLQAEAQLIAERKATSVATARSVAQPLPPARAAQIPSTSRETRTAAPQTMRKN